MSVPEPQAHDPGIRSDGLPLAVAAVLVHLVGMHGRGQQAPPEGAQAVHARVVELANLGPPAATFVPVQTATWSLIGRVGQARAGQPVQGGPAVEVILPAGQAGDAVAAGRRAAILPGAVGVPVHVPGFVRTGLAGGGVQVAGEHGEGVDEHRVAGPATVGPRVVDHRGVDAEVQVAVVGHGGGDPGQGHQAQVPAATRLRVVAAEQIAGQVCATVLGTDPHCGGEVPGAHLETRVVSCLQAGLDAIKGGGGRVPRASRLEAHAAGDGMRAAAGDLAALARQGPVADGAGVVAHCLPLLSRRACAAGTQCGLRSVEVSRDARRRHGQAGGRGGEESATVMMRESPDRGATGRWRQGGGQPSAAPNRPHDARGPDATNGVRPSERAARFELTRGATRQARLRT